MQCPPRRADHPILLLGGALVCVVILFSSAATNRIRLVGRMEPSPPAHGDDVTRSLGMGPANATDDSCALCLRVLYADAGQLGGAWFERLSSIVSAAQYDVIALSNLAISDKNGAASSKKVLAKAALTWGLEGGVVHAAQGRSGGRTLTIMTHLPVRFLTSATVGLRGGLLCAASAGLRLCVLAPTAAHGGNDSGDARHKAAESLARTGAAEAGALLAHVRALGAGPPLLLVGVLNALVPAQLAHGYNTKQQQPQRQQQQPGDSGKGASGRRQQSWAELILQGDSARERDFIQLGALGPERGKEREAARESTGEGSAPPLAGSHDGMSAVVNQQLLARSRACDAIDGALGTPAAPTQRAPLEPASAPRLLRLGACGAGQAAAISVELCDRTRAKSSRREGMLAGWPSPSAIAGVREQLACASTEPAAAPKPKPAAKALPPDRNLSTEEAAALQATANKLWPRVRVALPHGAAASSAAVLEARTGCAPLAALPGLANAARMLGSEAAVRRCQAISGLINGLQPQGRPGGLRPFRAHAYAHPSIPRLRSCAVVGGSGVLAVHPHGRLIDAHDHIFRVNACPVRGHEAKVGGRTSVRFVNVPQSRKWTLAMLAKGLLPSALNATDMVYMTVDKREKLEALAAKAKAAAHPVAFRAWTGAFRKQCVDPIWLSADKERHKAMNHVGGLEITFGFETLLHALYSCESVSVFGFFLDPADMTRSTNASAGGRMHYPYHYWENVTYDKSAKNPFMPWTYPFHNFVLEQEKMADMRAACLVETYVTDRPGPPDFARPSSRRLRVVETELGEPAALGTRTAGHAERFRRWQRAVRGGPGAASSSLMIADE